MLLQLLLCVVILVQQTSSQSTSDIIDAEPTLHLLNLLIETNFQLNSAIVRLNSTVSQLQKDITELKTGCCRKGENECPTNFTRLPTGGCYLVIGENLNWEDAGRRCRALHKDAHLIIISDALEQNLVASMLSNATETTSSCFSYSSHHGTYFWTLGQRRDPNSESPFVWRDASLQKISEMTYTNWSPGQPDYDHDSQSCMIMWSGLSYTWDDNICSYEYCSVCEI